HVAIDVPVVGQHAGGGHREGGVFSRGVTVVRDNRAGGAGRIVDRRDGDVDGGGSAVGLAVVGFVSETVRTVVIKRRDVGETAVGAQGQCAVGRAVDQDRGEHVAIDVAVVGQHAGDGHREGGVFSCGVTLVRD